MTYFTLPELTYSATAQRLGIDNAAPPVVVGRLNYLVDNLLDPLREAFGRPIVVNSGYRCQELNKAVGGVDGSYHLKGLAADVTALGRDRKENMRLWRLLRERELPYDVAIAYAMTDDGPLYLHLQIRDVPQKPDRYLNIVRR